MLAEERLGKRVKSVYTLLLAVISVGEVRHSGKMCSSDKEVHV